jgi:signal transduction histidine kinase
LKHSRLTRRITLTIVVLATAVGVLNLLDDLCLQGVSVLATLQRPQVWLLFLLALSFVLARFLKENIHQVLQIGVILILSGPVTLASPFTFFGMWFFVLSIILLYKYRFLNHWAIPKILLAAVYFVPFLILSVLNNEGLSSSINRAADYFIFLISCLFFLYFIFEEEIRDLLTLARTKDSELALKESELTKQAAEIARLEPLTVLGERVAHVTHSFKNNLGQVSTALFYLEFLHDEPRAIEKLHEFYHTITERIDSILMISRAGVDLKPEVFDVARLLEGFKYVYLSEQSFVVHAKTELTLTGPVIIEAIRWDFILMVENILKNALEAITAKTAFGTIRIDLAGTRLTIANDGGAMITCVGCGDSCLKCSKYGHPGQTSKKKGSGHGLAQVFHTCRNNRWGLKIRTQEQWTIFEICFKPD